MAERHAVRVVEGLRVLTLRHLAGGSAVIEAAATALGLVPLPQPGTCRGVDPCLVWVRPSEWLLLTSQPAIADSVLQALAPGRQALACALDQSAGGQVFELQGRSADALLPHLLGTGALPMRAGRGGRARCMDIAAVVLRPEPGRVWLVVDRAQGDYVAQWLAHAAQGEDEDAARPAGL